MVPQRAVTRKKLPRNVNRPISKGKEGTGMITTRQERYLGYAYYRTVTVPAPGNLA